MTSPSPFQDKIIGITIISFSLILYFYLIPNFVTEGQVADTMSPRFFPKLGTILIGFGGASLFLSSFVKNRDSCDKDKKIRSVLGPTLLIFAFSVFIFIFYKIGYVYAAPIFISSLMFIFGSRNYINIISISIIVSVAIYIIFTYGLNLPLE